MARDSHLDKLGDVPLFSACSRKDLQRIAKASDEVEVKAGRVQTVQWKWRLARLTRRARP